MSPSDLRTASVPPSPYLEANVDNAGTELPPSRTNRDLFVARRPVERFAVVIDPELVIVDTVGAQLINLGYFFVKSIDQSLFLGLKLCLSQLTPQALNMVPGCVKILLDAQRRVHK